MFPRGHRFFHSLSVAVGLSGLGVLWVMLPDMVQFREAKHEPLLFSESELVKQLASFKAPERPVFDADTRRIADLGRRIFFDPRFSTNGQISCGTCHQPGLSFTDGRPLAVGLTPLPRHTPSLLNSFATNWFFWDGRADSLTAQVQGPIETPTEHGFDRGRVAQVMWQQYRDDYVSLYGPWPSSLHGILTNPQGLSARPLRPVPELPLSLAHYALATISETRLQTRWINDGARAGIAPQRLLATRYLYSDEESTPAIESYRSLTETVQSDLDLVFLRFAWSLAQYERGLVALDSPFDRFVQRSEAQDRPVFSEDFGEKQWQGFRIFMESGCAQCHSGPMFSDQQFHNIGLPQGKGSLDLGRAAGILQVKADPFNCKHAFFADQTPSESCAELPFLRQDNTEMVGAFKTPSLRNVAETAPYMHDGGLPTLSAVLAHYNELKAEPAIGHRDEMLLPLRLPAASLASLELFLRALSSPIEDLSDRTQH